MKLQDFFDSFIDPEYQKPHGPLLEAGPSTVGVARRVQDAARATALIANTFWQAYVYSEAFVGELEHHRLPLDGLFKREIHVVPQRGYFTLWLPLSQVTRPLVFQAKALPGDLTTGWTRGFERRLARLGHQLLGGQEWVRVIAQGAWHYLDPLRIPLSLGLTPQVAVEANNNQPFFVLVTPAMDEEWTSVPSPALEVAVASVGQRSTAGARVQDSHGRVGVTAAAHAVSTVGIVTVDGVAANVCSIDAKLTDSCFLEVPGISAACRSSRGPLKLAPRMHETVTFEGLITRDTTKIVSFNYELPYLDPDLQQTVRTDLVTAGGDSGAALLDQDGYIVGFAYNRSPMSVQAPYSSWIWADSVFTRHGLTVY